MQRVILAATALALATLPALADQKLTPSWIKGDAGKKTATMEVVAGWNADNGALNFNGYSNATMTVVVPANWTVRVNFVNHDGMLPHSVLVTKQYPKDQIPPQAGVGEVAISKAYSKDPESGIEPNAKDNFSFIANKPGDYWYFCGVPGHGVQGMYVNFKIDPRADQPYVLVADKATAGWK